MTKDSRAINKLFDFFSNDIKITDDIIIDNCDAKSPLIKEMSQHIIQSGGKRIRPILVILSNLIASGQKSEKIYNLCAAVELIHTATLLHDDVIDNSFLRRGDKTANAIWDNKASILVGDFLFSLSFQLMVTTNSIKILETLSRASNTIADGEVNQLQHSGNIDLTVEKYLEIIEGKTAALFAASCSSGAILGDAKDDQVAKLHEIGNNIGILFQITDDLMDYGFAKLSNGKNIGDDFYESKITLPIILTLNIADDNDKEAIEELFYKSSQSEANEDDLKKLLEIVNKYDGVSKSKDMVSQYQKKSLAAIASFDESDYTNYLSIIVNNISQRAI